MNRSVSALFVSALAIVPAAGSIGCKSALLVSALAIVPVAGSIGCKSEPEVDPAEEAKKLENSVTEAQARIRSGKVADAERILEHALSQHPDHPPAIAAMGKVRYQQGRYDEAAKLLQQAIAGSSTDPEIHAMYGYVLVKKDDHSGAAQAFAKAFELDEDNSEYGLFQGISLLKAKQPQEAAKVLTTVAELDPKAITPEGVGVHTFLADAQRDMGQLDDALRTYMKAQNTYASDKMARAGAAFVYEAKDDVKHALDEWSAYIRMDCCSDYSKNVARTKVMELGGEEAAAGDIAAGAAGDPGEAKPGDQPG